MGGRGNSRYSSKNVFVQARSDGTRQYFEHDDRGSNRNSGGSGNKGNYRNSYQGGRPRGGGRGGRNWDVAHWDYDRGVPEGHWRGNTRGRGGSSRGYRTSRPPRHPDEDIDMGGNKDRNRRQDMYKSRGGGRRGKGSWNNKRDYSATNNLGWHKIIINNACNLDKQEVLDSIRSLVEEPFTPIMFEVEGKSLVFYLEDNGPAAHGILEVNRRITLSNGHRLSLYSNRSPPPNRALTQAQIDRVMKIMSERYVVEMKRLDLKKFHNDSTLVQEGIFCPLYRNPNMKIVVDVIVSQIPHVEEIDLSHNKMSSLAELERLVNLCPNLKRLSLAKNKILNEETMDKLTGLHIIDLTLEDNPVCDKFRDTETYISAVRKRFPKVIYLDGQELPKPIGFEVDEEVSKIPPSVSTYFVAAEVKSIVVTFITQYYQIFDTPEREPLKAAYTENALFTFTCNFPDTGPESRYSNIYISKNRNLKKNKDADRRYKAVVHGRSNIGQFLSQLPYTSHDPSSFTLDISVAQPSLLFVTLGGVFKQLADQSLPIRFFTRTLVIVPEGSGYCICNEQLHITRATVDQVKKAFKNPGVGIAASPQRAPVAPAVATSPAQVTPVPENTASGTLQPVQEAMIIKFCEASGMLPQYSQLCLEQNEWDFNKAGKMFTELKAENKIPAEYFAQCVT